MIARSLTIKAEFIREFRTIIRATLDCIPALLVAIVVCPVQAANEVSGLNTSACTGVAPHSVRLNDLIELALSSQPQVLVAKEAVSKAHANMIAARSPFLPNVNLSLDSERFVPSTITPPISIGNTVVGGTTATKTTYGSIGLSWNLYNGGRDSAAYLASKSDIRASEAGLSQQLNETVIGVLNTYADIYKAQQEANAQRRILELQQAIEKLNEAQYKQGTTTTLVIAQAQTYVLETSRSLIQACRTVADKSAILAQTVGLHLNPDELYYLSDPLVEPINHNPSDVDWQRIVQDDPAVRAAKESVSSAEYKVKETKAAYLPTLSLDGRKDYLGQDPDSWRTADHITPNSYRIGLRIQVPLLPLTSEYSSIQSAKSDLRKAQAQLQQVQLETEAKYHTAFNAIHEADESLIAANNSRTQANELLNLTQSLYASGRVDMSKVQQAQVVVEKAESAVNQALSDQRLAHWLVQRVSNPQLFTEHLLNQFNVGATAMQP